VGANAKNTNKLLKRGRLIIFPKLSAFAKSKRFQDKLLTVQRDVCPNTAEFSIPAINYNFSQKLVATSKIQNDYSKKESFWVGNVRCLLRQAQPTMGENIYKGPIE
jgi:hypothetical protein